MSFEELKEKYEAIEKKKSDTSARCTPLIADFLALLFQGDARCLKYLGATCWYSDKPDPDEYHKYSIHYLKAAVMFDNDPEAWLYLAIIHFGRRQYHTDHATCELKFAWYHSTEEQTELRNRICSRRLMDDSGLCVNSFAGIDLKLNSLDYLWSIMPASWMAIYRTHFKERFKKELQTLKSQNTENRLNSDDMLKRLCHYGFDSETQAWLALTRHFQWQSQPFYLFYANNKLNKLPIVKDLLEDMMTRCGYDVRFLEWDTFNDSIPDNAVVGVLTDMALFHASRKENQAYQAVQKHTGKKLLIPWQLPIPDNETFWEVYWNSLPEDWKGDWIHIRVSLFDNLLACLLGRHGMLPHLFPQITESHFSPLVNYFWQRMLEGKLFKDLYPDGQVKHFDLLSIFTKDRSFDDRQAELEHIKDQISTFPQGLQHVLLRDDNHRIFYQQPKPVALITHPNPEPEALKIQPQVAKNLEEVQKKYDSRSFFAASAFTSSFLLYAGCAVAALVCTLTPGLNLSATALIVILSIATLLLASSCLLSRTNPCLFISSFFYDSKNKQPADSLENNKKNCQENGK